MTRPSLTSSTKTTRFQYQYDKPSQVDVKDFKKHEATHVCVQRCCGLTKQTKKTQVTSSSCLEPSTNPTTNSGEIVTPPTSIAAEIRWLFLKNRADSRAAKNLKRKRQLQGPSGTKQRQDSAPHSFGNAVNFAFKEAYNEERFQQTHDIRQGSTVKKRWKKSFLSP